jgi:hypothetical protein
MTNYTNNSLESVELQFTKTFNGIDNVNGYQVMHLQTRLAMETLRAQMRIADALEKIVTKGAAGAIHVGDPIVVDPGHTHTTIDFNRLYQTTVGMPNPMMRSPTDGGVTTNTYHYLPNMSLVVGGTY